MKWNDERPIHIGTILHRKQSSGRMIIHYCRTSNVGWMNRKNRAKTTNDSLRSNYSISRTWIYLRSHRSEFVNLALRDIANTKAAQLQVYAPLNTITNTYKLGKCWTILQIVSGEMDFRWQTNQFILSCVHSAASTCVHDGVPVCLCLCIFVWMCVYVCCKFSGDIIFRII